VNYVFVDPAKSFQTILGFGGALTDAAAETYAKLPAALRRELIHAYYDPVEGIGYTLGRTHINSCDFSSGSYDYVKKGDAQLTSFSIEHDLRFRVPMIQEAIAAAGGKLTLFASPWSPPAWMKDNGDMLHGGKLKPEYRQAWANYYVAFLRAYEGHGIPIWGFSVQNEPMAIQPWESCFYTGEEERDFIKNYLGPTLQKNGLGDRKIIIWDHNRTLMYERARVVLDDPEAAKYVWGVGFHWYVNAAENNVRLVKEAYPQTHLLFTEGCLYPFNPDKMGEWQWGEAYGHAILRDLNNGADGWCDWNILLNEQGGPNHLGNYCFAPVHADTRTGQLTYLSSYFYMGHFSKFIRPGAKRVISSATVDTLETTAFVNPDKSMVCVVLNATDAEIPFALTMNNRSVRLQSPAHSIMTLVAH
jgi:glucosylceramidase